ncbi:hypothetical protein ASE59_14200 [Sphingomonas sp. Leaf10]|nr:hypothetical protein ASE59_14200 [Sphingomonas sp. Leaf10]
MSDVVDFAAQIEADRIARGIAEASQPMAVGVAGECDECEWWMPRLVGGLCPYCRDGRPRPADWEPPVPPNSSSAPVAPAISKEPAPMPAKSIQLPAAAQNAIRKVEELAQSKGISIGQAAAELIDREIALPASNVVTVDLCTIGVPALLDHLRAAFDDRADHSAELVALIERAEAAEVRATAAEEKLAQFKALLA